VCVCVCVCVNIVCVRVTGGRAGESQGSAVTLQK